MKTTPAPSDRIIIFDTTLRDGEQSPGASMNLEEKLRVAEALRDLGVDVIEAGFAIASNGDFEAVNAIAGSIKGPTICSLSRAIKADISRAAEALAPAENKRIHTFISTSPLHMKYKLQMTPEQVIEKIADSVTFARQFTDDVEWSAEDGARTEIDFLCRAVETAIDSGATTVNIPDTVGYTMPDEFGDIITTLFNRVPNIDKAVVSVHCHNDLGLAVANSLAAVNAGARQIECTINGLGERAGNAALEEIVMGVRTRADLLPYDTGIDTTKITHASRIVSAVSGFVVQPNKAIVGANAFAHESGIHQDGFLKHAETYEIMTPESVGLSKSSLVMGKHSGRHAFKEKLRDLGFDNPGDNVLEDAFIRFKALADKKKEVFDDDIIALLDEQMRDDQPIKFVSLSVSCGSRGPQTADLEIEVQGEVHTAHSSGDGPVDATFNAVKAVIPHRARLKLYQVQAVTAGTDAQASVTVRLEENGKTVIGSSSDTDTIVASCKAYVNALNKLDTKREKTAPADDGDQSADTHRPHQKRLVG